jgi:hypothetical protein
MSTESPLSLWERVRVRAKYIPLSVPLKERAGVRVIHSPLLAELHPRQINRKAK